MPAHSATLAAAAAALLAGCGARAQVAPAAPEPAARPNIVLVLADDLGWVDTSLTGSGYYQTPNIERLAARGVLFTHAYAANPLCSPTRASILTGKYPGRLNLTSASGHLAENSGAPAIGESAKPDQRVVTPNARNQLALSEVTVAELLRDAGYDTWFLGKWHLGRQPRHWPDHQGFAVNIGGAGNPGPGSFFSPYKLNNLRDGPEGEHITDRMAAEATALIEGRPDDAPPFLMFLWEWNVHGPWQARPELVEKYRGITDPNGIHDCATMGAMIESLDECLGRVMDALEREGIADETIIVFTSDNGGNTHTRLRDAVTGKVTAPTSNAPLSAGKARVREGGVRVPLVIAWPGVTDAATVSTQVTTSPDLFPTILEWASVPLPAELAPQLDGLSLAGHLRTGRPLDREAIFCHFPHYIPLPDFPTVPATTVRRGDWKLIRSYGEGPGLTNKLELYNLAEDIGETTDRAAEHPALVAELDALIDEHLARTGAIVPFLNPAYTGE